MREISVVLDGLSFPECPRWHEGRIWVSDFYTHQVLSAREDGSGSRVEAEVPGQPSGLGWLPDGRLLVVSQKDNLLLRRERDGSLVTHADLSAHVAGEPNDMVVDERGRAFVGNFGFDYMGGAPLASTVLLRVDPDGAVTEVADDVWFPNGSVITDDGVLLVDETFGNRITAFDLGADGALANRRVWASFGAVPTERDMQAAGGQLAVAPDGCGLDADGALWVADARGGRVLRIREGGDVLEELRVDTGVFACMLGGHDGRTLFLCTAPDSNRAARSASRAARLLSCRVDVPHAGRP